MNEPLPKPHSAAKAYNAVKDEAPNGTKIAPVIAAVHYKILTQYLLCLDSSASLGKRCLSLQFCGRGSSSNLCEKGRS